MLSLALAFATAPLQSSSTPPQARRPVPTTLQILPVQPQSSAATFAGDLDCESLPPPNSTLGGGVQSNPAADELGSAPLFAEYIIQVPNLGQERLLFQRSKIPSPRPLLVLFHKYSTNHYDPLLNTHYFQEAWRRGWNCVAPFGGNQTHYSSMPSQQRLDAVFDWIDANFAVDRARVYGVGFSMGGGAATNYAARHLDPNDYVFAAVVNISGMVSHEYTYLNELSAQPRFDDLFGVPPNPADPWRMQRSSLFSFDPFSFVTLPDTDLARNLLHISTASFRASGDIPYLATENDLLQQHLLALGANPAQHSLTVVPTAPFYHSWNVVDEGVVCNWLKTKSAQWPSSGNTLADRNARYFYFEVEQDVAGAFTPFQWSIQSAPNTLSLGGTRNLKRLAVHTLDAGLDRQRDVQITLSAADGIADELTLLDWPTAPLDVLRDGVSSQDWSHDANAGKLSLLEFDAAAHVWTIVH
ncbi:MAG: hypothetical protein IT454_09255 [Planctomycetes bacterium]|nr:hypothetical protein [Planctomycetota bacterium]